MRYKENELKDMYPKHYTMMREICAGRACGTDCPLSIDCPYNFDLKTIENAYTMLFGKMLSVQEDDILSLLGE